MLPARCTAWAGTLKRQHKPSRLFPLTFPVRLLLERSETQRPWRGRNWKMGLVGRYDSKAPFRAPIPSPGDYRVSCTKISVSRCHQARTGRNFTRREECSCRGSEFKETFRFNQHLFVYPTACSSIQQEADFIPFTAAVLFTASLSMSICHWVVLVLCLQQLTRACHQTGLWRCSIDHPEGNGYRVGGNQLFTSPWSRSASVLSSTRQKPPGRYFLRYISSRGRLVCQRRVIGLKGHRCDFLLSFGLNLVLEEGRKENWCWGPTTSGWRVQLSKSEVLLRLGEICPDDAKASPTPPHIRRHKPTLRQTVETP